MKQGSGQFEIQQQKMVQRQNLAPLQAIAARLTEMSLEALRQRVDNECVENPYLERKDDGQDDEDSYVSHDTEDTGSPDMESASDDIANDYSSEDDIPDNMPRSGNTSDQIENVEYSDTISFSDMLKEQIGEYELTAEQQQVLEYLIGSLEDNGLLKKSTYQIVNELSIYQNIDITEEQLEDILHVLWQFDPAGVGARSVQECLLIQIRRDAHNPHREQMEQIVSKHYDLFLRKKWDQIQQRMHLTNSQMTVIRENILRLNPNPGTALSESTTMGSHPITPDFLVEVDDCGQIQMSLNEGDIPTLVVSPDILETLKKYDGQKPDELGRAAREDMAFYRSYAEHGQLFINAMEMRRDSMLRTMKAIIKLQRPFFLEGDESLLVPMKLEDVAKMTNLDISTISRVSNNKYVQTNYGIYPLRWFFNSRSSQDGEEVSVRKVKAALREMIEHEDKNRPLNDDQLTKELEEKGFQIARRTVAKYREQLGIPVARLRRS